MFTGNDLPDLGGLITALLAFAVVGGIAIAIVGVQTVAWLFQHVHVSL